MPILSFRTEEVRPEGEDTIIIRPMEQQHSFPQFNSIDVQPDGRVIGWYGDPSTISGIGCFEFGKLGKVTPVSQSPREVVFKTLNN